MNTLLHGGIDIYFQYSVYLISLFIYNQNWEEPFDLGLDNDLSVIKL